MSKRNRFGQILIETKRSRYRARDLRHFERMRQSGSIMVTFRVQKNLRLMFQTPKCLTV
jgi:hypothetical protein